MQAQRKRGVELSCSEIDNSKRKKPLFYCPHCKQHVSKTAFYNHRAQFYQEETMTWLEETGTHSPKASVSAFSTESFKPSASSISVSSEHEDLFKLSEDSQAVHYDLLEQANDHALTMEDERQNTNDIDSWQEDPPSQLAFCTSEPTCEAIDDTNIPYTQKRLIKWLIITLLTFQSLFHISDSAMTYLFAFISGYIWLLATTLRIDSLAKFSTALPCNVSRARSIVEIREDRFTIFPSCPTCDTIYDLSKCIVEKNSKKQSAICQAIEFPNHPHKAARNPCGSILMKICKSPSGSIFLYPIHPFCYQPVIKALESVLFRIRSEICVRGANNDGLLTDIHDGRMWEKFMQFSQQYPSALCLSLTLNVDWFQPYDHLTDSVGAMYLVINNLPRHIRFKQQNVLLVGMIPGPSEPHNINTFLSPLIDELKEFETTGKVIGNDLVYCILSCISNDIPAARKVCGFASHSARLACSKCLKIFPTEKFGEKPDFSGFDVANWTPRTCEQVKAIGIQYLQAKTKQAQKSILREHGCRYSLLHELTTFDIVRCTVIDPMHNLFLGTSKHVLNTWKLTIKDFDKNLLSIQNKADNICVPRDIGRIPSKISSGFSGFTADQWRSWTLMYSIFCLQNVIPSEHLECWRVFVIACSLFSCKVLTPDSVKIAHQFIIRFCQLASILFGKSFCTINMHLHCHLYDCVLDYGPFHSFWLFSFERYNGILGEYPTNHKAITIQLMRKFCNQVSITSIQEELPADLKSSFESFLHYGRLRGSVKQSLDPVSITVKAVKYFTCDMTSTAWTKVDNASLQPPIKEKVISSDDFEHLKKMYKLMYSPNMIKHVNRCVAYSERAFSGCLKFCSSTVSNSIVMALWGENNQTVICGEIEYIMESVVELNSDCGDESVRQIIACVKWYKKHPLHTKLGFPCFIYSQDFELSISSFIPLARIFSRCAIIEYKIDNSISMEFTGQTVNVVTPIDFLSSSIIINYLFPLYNIRV